MNRFNLKSHTARSHHLSNRIGEATAWHNTAEVSGKLSVILLAMIFSIAWSGVIAASPEKRAPEQADGPVAATIEPSERYTPAIDPESGSRSDSVGVADSASPEATTIIFFDEFESALPGVWDIFDSDGLAFGEVFWGNSSFRADMGAGSAGAASGGTDASPPGANYSDDMDTWMIYGPFDLSGADGAELSFRYWLDSELNFDFLQWFASIDGINFWGNQISGNSAGWQSGILDFTDVFTLGNITGEPAVWIAFRFISDESNTAEGAYVDEVYIHASTLSDPCYSLTLSHTGAGSDPVAAPSNSSGCPNGSYHPEEVIGLSATPAAGWGVGSWSGTNNNASTSTNNQLTMPATERSVTVNYVQDGPPPGGSGAFFVPMIPCRIFDTRAPFAGGPFGGGATRDFRVKGLLDFQGGSNDCGIPDNAVAIHVNFTAVNPTGFGYLRAWPYGEEEPVATLVVFDQGSGISNATALSICDSCPFDITVKIYEAVTDLVGDVVGYYQLP